VQRVKWQCAGRERLKHPIAGTEAGIEQAVIAHARQLARSGIARWLLSGLG
jgi:hypothetical protein